MKKQLLKKLIMTVAFFASIIITAQQGPVLYDFAGGAQSWVKGFGNGTVVHDPTGGVAMDGALTVAREGNNNANIRRGQGGDDAFIVLDRGVYNFMKIRYKNETAAKSFRIQGFSRAAGTTGAGATWPNEVVGGISFLSPEYNTVYVDLSFIPEGNEVTTLDIYSRVDAGSDPVGSLIVFDEIEFLASIPPASLSGIVQNASFDDLGGSISPFNPANKAYATVVLSSDDKHSGTHSLKHEYTDVTTDTHFVFNDYIHDLGASTSDFIIGSVWVKVVRPSTPGVSPIIDVQGQGRFGTTLVIGDLITKSDPKTTIKTDGTWEQINFEFTPDGPYSTAQFRYGIGGAELQNGDIIYVDDLHAETAVTLTVKENTLEGVSIYPNPASKVVNVSSVNGGDISIHNILGAKVLSEKATSKTHQLNVSSLTSGMYLLRIVSDNKSSTKKLIIN